MNTNKKPNKILTGYQSLRFLGITTLTAVIVIGIGAVVSAQKGTVNKNTDQKTEGLMTDKTDRNSESVSRQAAQIDERTGQLRPLTAEEAKKMTDGIKHLVNQSDEGLEQVVHSDGSVSVDLQGRFQNVVIARKNTDDTVATSCVDNNESAASFLGTKQKKSGNQSKTASTVNQIERDSKGAEIK